MNVSDQPDFDDHRRITYVSDPESGLRAIHAIHRTVQGKCGGGVRFRPYRDETEALTDALRLSRAMTYKFCLSGLPLGGAKAVIIGDPAQLKTPELLAAFGRYMQSLNGLYTAGPDIGTNADDMVELAKFTPLVAGRADRSGSTALPTAQGTFVALKATAGAAFGTDDLSGLSVAVQGVGGVGALLVQMLIEAGASVVAADVDQAAVEAAAEVGARIVSPEAILEADVDLVSPCAMGAILTEDSIETVRARAICGCANNQLATPECADLLDSKGILWAPDYIASAGG
ncbi:MAG: Glu/Leu/Phe/Val dehydrogenase, partial [bacterium]|nr:Glu/Leu/Phe/Val dehydrogenase [bacterium]